MRSRTLLTQVLAVNAVLGIAYLGIVLYYNFGYDGYDFEAMILHVNRLYAVPMIFLFAGAVVSLAVSVLVLGKVRSKVPSLKTVGAPAFPPPLSSLVHTRARVR